jgi:hypothetical protein
MTKTTADAILSELAQFHGGETLYRHRLGFTFTEGVRHLADRCGAFWLIDLIGSFLPDVGQRLTDAARRRLSTNDARRADALARPARVNAPTSCTHRPPHRLIASSRRWGCGWRSCCARWRS